MFTGLCEEELLDVVDECVAVLAEGDGTERGGVKGVLLWFGGEDAGDVFRVGVHDTAEEGELYEVEAEVGVFWREAPKYG